MSRLKTTTALGLVVGLGLALASTAPTLAAEKTESGAGAAHEKTLPSGSNLGAAGAVKTPSVAEQAGDKSQGEMDKGAGTEQAASTIPGGLTAEEIIGRDVVNKKGEEVGQVESLVIQPDKGDVHAVISVGGFLGIGDRDVAVPLEEMEFGEDNVTLMSQQTKEELEAMPEYKEDEWRLFEDQPAEESKSKSE